MKRVHFPKQALPVHPPIVSANQVIDEQMTVGQRMADRVSAVVGSWPFILGQSALLLLWVALNVTALVRHWDPYPFILMNLVLSLQAAFTAPVIMMSQNRQSMKDRLEAHNDFVINQKAEAEIRSILTHLDAQNQAFMQLFDITEKIQATLDVRATSNGGDADKADHAGAS